MRLPRLSPPPPLGALAVGSHILSATFLDLVFSEIDDDCRWSAETGGGAFPAGQGIGLVLPDPACPQGGVPGCLSSTTLRELGSPLLCHEEAERAAGAASSGDDYHMCQSE